MARRLLVGPERLSDRQTEPRPSADTINQAPTIVNTGQRVSADGATIPIIYGRDKAQGLIFAETVYNGDLYSGVIWSLGEIYAVESVFINDQAPPAGVEVRHYRGTTTQGVDSWLSTAISGYSDTWVISDRGQSLGIAYSVFKISSGALSSVPNYRAIIQGKLINDPNASSNSDPYFDLNGIDVDFTSGGTDSSNNSHTITLGGGASIDSGGLQLISASPAEYATVADAATLEVGTSTFCLEVVATSTTVAAGTAILISHGTTTSPLAYSLQIKRSADALLLYLSSTGSTWDIANGTNIGTITTAKFYSTIERVGNEIVAYLDGAETARVEISPTSPVSTVAIFDSPEAWYLSDPTGSEPWVGSVQGWRKCIGVNRYGSAHTATATPFADSDSYGAKTVYSTNPALMWADMASNPLYGLGATIEGDADAATYCNGLLDGTCGSPLIKRCETGYTISSHRKVEYWLDILAMYANCIWFPWGSNLRIQPDQRITALDPSGLDVLVDGDFDELTSPIAWTLGDGWAIGSGVVTVDGTQSAESILSQTVTTDQSTEYSISITISVMSAGNISVDFGGTEVIAAQSTAGQYAGVIITGGISTLLEIKADADAVATITVAYVKRSYFKATKWRAGTLTLEGPTERGSPTSVKINYTTPSSSTPNWATASTVFTSPLAEDGTLPFIQTALDLPGVQREGEANNKAVQRVQRMHDRWSMSYVAPDIGVYHRIGDAVQPTSSYRGVSRSMWVESIEMVSPGEWRVSGQRYANVHFPDNCVLNLCSPDLPTSGTIQADTLYQETVLSTSSNSFVFGVLGAEGDSIILNPGSDKIVYSSNGGESFSETGELPASIDHPSDTSKWLISTSWQYVNGLWFSHLRESDGSNVSSYIASTSDGSSWVIGDNLHNGRYSRRSVYIDESRAIVGGRRSSGNNLMWENYDNIRGSSTEATDILVGPSNQNSEGLLKLSDGFFAARWTGSQMKADHIGYDFANNTLGTRTAGITTDTSIATEFVSNGIDTVLITQSDGLKRWQKGYGALETAFEPPVAGEPRVNYGGGYWLCVNFGEVTQGTAQCYHSTDQDAQTWVTGPSISLPENFTSSSPYFERCNLLYWRDGYWLAYYRRSSDNRLILIKFKYGDPC